MQAKEDAEDAQWRWDTAMCHARFELEYSWQEHLRKEEAFVPLNVRELEPSTMLANSVWMEQLKEPLEAKFCAKRECYYDLTREAETFILLKVNCNDVGGALGRAHEKLEELLGMVDFSTLRRIRRIVSKKQARAPEDLYFKLTLWRELAGPKIDVAIALQKLKDWRLAWDSGFWQKHIKTRRDTVSDLVQASKVIKRAAESMYFTPQFAPDRIAEIARRDLSESPEGIPAYPRKKKARNLETPKEEHLAAFKRSRVWDIDAIYAYRQRFSKAARCYYQALAAFAEPTLLTEGEVGLAEELEKEVQVNCRALQKVASELRSKDQEETVKELMGTLDKMEVLRQTVAAAKDKIKEEKAELEASRLKFYEEKETVVAAVLSEARACKKCRERPHNMVVIPCSHATYCSECLEDHSKTSSSCPICAGPIKGTLRYLV